MRRIDTDRIHQAIRRELPPSLHAKYEKFVRDKRLIVLFDGMDEMPRRHYGEYVRVLSDFGGAYRAIIKTLFSCRINDFSPDFRHNQLVLQSFNSYQIHKYLAGVLPPVCLIEGAPLSAKSIARRLMSGNLSSQLSNPLMLFLTAQYILAEQSWPESRVVLFLT